MRKYLLVGLVAGLTTFVGVTAAAVAGPDGSDEATMCVYTTQLRAENEVPAVVSEAFGHSQIKVRNDGTIEFKTHIVNPAAETFVAGHIHRGAEGANGPVVQSLFVPPATSEEQIMQSGDALLTPPGLGAAICADPTAYYVNYHTTVFPGGAIRGQLG
jgi:hypothetical protein